MLRRTHLQTLLAAAVALVVAKCSVTTTTPANSDVSFYKIADCKYTTAQPANGGFEFIEDMAKKAISRICFEKPAAWYLPEAVRVNKEEGRHVGIVQLARRRHHILNMRLLERAHVGTRRRGVSSPIKGNRNNKTFLQRLRCILCVITLHSIISYYKMRFYTRKTELEASTCQFPRKLRS